jgi:hypothetical protein
MFNVGGDQYAYTANCEKHLWMAIAVGIADWHPWSPDCLMPGSIWDGEQGRCVVPDEDDFLAAVEQQKLCDALAFR